MARTRFDRGGTVVRTRPEHVSNAIPERGTPPVGDGVSEGTLTRTPHTGIRPPHTVDPGVENVTSLRTRRGTAAGALALLTALLAWLVVAASPARADGPTLTVSKTTGLNPDGELVTVTGQGFVPNISLFVTVCDPAKPAGAACDGLNYKLAPVDAAGNFTVQVKAAAKFGNTDCLVTPCAFQTSRVGMGKDRTQETTVAINFTGGVPASLPTKPQENAGPPAGAAPGADAGAAQGGAGAAASAPQDGQQSTAPDTGAGSANPADPASSASDDGGDDDGMSTGVVLGIAAGVVVVVGAGTVVFLRRRNAA